MGADSYTYKKMKVIMKDGNSHIIILSKIGNYYSINYDSDSEDDYNRKVEEYEKDLMKMKNRKILYKDNEWLITSKSKREEYVFNLNGMGVFSKENTIEFSDVLQMEIYYTIESRV
jgi:hypothetical protein